VGLRNGAHRQGRIRRRTPRTVTRRVHPRPRVRGGPGVTPRPACSPLSLRHREADALEARLRCAAELEAPDRPQRDDERVRRVGVVGMHVQRDHAESRLGLDLLEHEARAVGELDLDDGRLDAVRRAERRDRPVKPRDELLVRALRGRRPDAAAQKSFASPAASPMCARPSVVIVRPRGVRWM